MNDTVIPVVCEPQHKGIPMIHYRCGVCNSRICTGPPIFQWKHCIIVCESCWKTILRICLGGEK